MAVCCSGWVQEVHRMFTTIGTYCYFYMAVCCPGWVQKAHRTFTTISTYCSFLDGCLLSWLGSGGTPYIYNNWHILLFFRWLSVVLAGFRRYNVHLQKLVLTVVNIRCTSRWWAVHMAEICRGVWWNILKINCASSWFSFTQLLFYYSYKLLIFTPIILCCLSDIT